MFLIYNKEIKKLFTELFSMQYYRANQFQAKYYA